MNLHALAESLERVDVLDRVVAPLRRAVKGAIPAGAVKDALSGTWLGHPLHPLLTDVPIGSFTSATVLDIIGGRRSQNAADVLVGIGVLSAVPTALAGAADWSDTEGGARRVGVVHALSNAVGVGLFATSLVARRRGRRCTGRLLGLAAMASMTVGGYLGGYLSYSRGIGVNRAFDEEPPEDWTPVIGDAELAEGAPTRVEAAGVGVLLYRSGGQIRAIGSRCSHAGGPLEEGTIDTAACTVQCPWHESTFRLTDGGVVHGPATTPQVAYDARVEGGQIQVRRRSNRHG